MIGPVQTHGLNGTGSSVSDTQVRAITCRCLEGKEDLNRTTDWTEAELDRTGTCFLDTSFVHQARLVFFSTLENYPTRDFLVGHLISNQPSGKSGSQSLLLSLLHIVVSVVDALWPWNSPLLTGRRAHPSSLPPSSKAAGSPHHLRCFRPGRHLARTALSLSVRPGTGPTSTFGLCLRVRDPPPTQHLPKVYAIASWTSSDSVHNGREAGASSQEV